MIDKELDQNDLKLLNTRLSLALNSGEIGVWDWDIETNTTIWDNKMFEIYGLSKQGSMPYDNWINAVVLEDREKAEASLKRVISNKTKDSVEFRIMKPDKSIRYIESSEDVVCDNAGKVIRVIGINIDITKRKEKEDKYKQQNTELLVLKANLDSAIKIANLGLWEWDVLKNITTWSDITYDIYGVEKNTPLNIEFVESLIIEEDRSFHKKMVNQCFKDKKTITFEYRIKKNNEIRIILAFCEPILKEKEIVKLAGIVQDIISIKEKEKDLLFAQKISEIGHYDFNIEENSFTSSPILNEVLGISENYIKTFETWLELVFEDDKEMMKNYFIFLVENKTNFDKEYRIVNQQTNEIKWVHGLGIIIFNEKDVPLRMFGTIQDITERKNYQKQMQRALSVFENTQDGIMITDKNNKLISVNPAFSKITGYRIDEVIGKNPSILKSHKHDKEFYKDMWKKINTTGSWSGDISNKNKDEKIYEIYLTISTIKNNKRIENYIAVFSDRTIQKEQEDMIIQQSRTSAIGEMIGNIAHQWRQPLSVISTASSGLKLQLEMNNKLEKEDLYYSLDMITQQTQHLSKTIEDFRDFFTGSITEIGEFDLIEAFEEVNELTKNTFSNNFIEVEQYIEKNISIVANKNLLVQALLNIYNNSIEALQNTELKDGEKLFHVSLKRKESKILIIIKDNAGGIKEQDIKKVFDPYFTTKHKSQGTGIGLYMTNQIIVKQLKGEIIVNNIELNYKDKKYIGAEFTIIL